MTVSLRRHDNRNYRYPVTEFEEICLPARAENRKWRSRCDMLQKTVPDPYSGDWKKAWVLFLICIAFYSNYGLILYHFRNKTRYWSKMANFSYPLHLMPPFGGFHLNTAIMFGMEKPEWCGYPTVTKSLIICLAVSTQYWHMKHRRMDILRQLTPHAMHSIAW